MSDAAGTESDSQRLERLRRKLPWLAAGATLAADPEVAAVELPTKTKRCHGCGSSGHDRRNCPALPKIKRRCAWCRTEGHVAKTCPTRPADVAPCEASARARAATCRRCRQIGHAAPACPEKPAHSKRCTFCRAEGHQINTCPAFRAARPDIPPPVVTPVRPKTYRCSICRADGHRAPGCPMRPVETDLVDLVPAPTIGDMPAATVDVSQHLVLVERVARRIAKRIPPGVPFDDLISAGHLGLMEAAARFDPTQSASFGTFAEFRVRGAILDDLRGKDSLSRDMRTLAKKIRKAAAAVETETGQTAATDELAAKLGIGVDELHRQQQKAAAGAVVVGIEDAPIAVAHVPDARAPDPFEEAARAELRANLSAAVQGLPERMALVLTMRYGQGMTLAAIGAALGCSESRACQIEGEAVARLRFRGAETDLTDLVPEEAAAETDRSVFGVTNEEPKQEAPPRRLRDYRRSRTIGLLAQGRQRHHLRILTADGEADDGPLPPRPLTRGDCIDGPRPCPWVSCRHHLYLDVSETGGIRLNHPDLEPDQVPHSCSLDIADDGPHTLEAVGDITQVTRERVRQIEVWAVKKAKAAAQRIGVEDAPERFHSPLGAEMSG
jgi:RNA polymerase sigma factor for flagellar operon FliA